MPKPINIFWFRRDLRMEDNAGLYHALRAGNEVLPVFIFDTNILDGLENKEDKRVHFIHDALAALQDTLLQMGSTLHALHGPPGDCFKRLMQEYTLSAVYANHDYEPYARKRDHEIAGLLRENGIGFHTFKDQVIFETDEILKDNGGPYTVYTPYSRRWKEKRSAFYTKPYPIEKYSGNFYPQAAKALPALEDLGFKNAPPHAAPPKLNEAIARHYDETRDIPGIEGTTRLGAHLRFGTVSIRKLVAEAGALNDKLVNELIWRDFYQMILWHFPHVVNQSFKKEYDNIQWRNNEREFGLWCAGKTGYPIVDAGMRQLNETGYMHNRVRMVTASFLTRHLLTDWRWGEAYFAEKLLDYDLAANNGGWQWAAGSGCDAAPYFRIFNPYLQAQKFDPQGKYIHRWVPELEGLLYPAPIVAHEAARQRCLKVYKDALGK
jgi:deoxyribodipyrimidine photo-lyase